MEANSGFSKFLNWNWHIFYLFFNPSPSYYRQCQKLSHLLDLAMIAFSYANQDNIWLEQQFVCIKLLQYFVQMLDSWVKATYTKSWVPVKLLSGFLFFNPNHPRVFQNNLSKGGVIIIPPKIDHFNGILFLQGLRYVYKGLESKISGP